MPRKPTFQKRLKRVKKRLKKHRCLDLDSWLGRVTAYLDLYLFDHGFFRCVWDNYAELDSAFSRRNQPSPRHIRKMAKNGVKTLINLRGESHSGYYYLEKEACEKHGIELVDFRVLSRKAPTKDHIHKVKDLFEQIEYPAVMHCKSGADRAGMMAVFYNHFRLGETIDEAMKHGLSMRFGHISSGKTGILDFFFHAYLEYSRTNQASFIEWVDHVYDEQKLIDDFQPKWWGMLCADLILRRE
jgi:protein tyrosine phosphatase (PTP) superfamily phosphohydrolase (DUF442 family)